MSHSEGRAADKGQGNTGAPGDASSTCSANNCHGSSSISVEMSIEVRDMNGTVVSTVNKGETYNVKVSVNHTGGSTPAGYGFQLVALDDANVSTNSFSNPSSNTQIASANNGRQYAEQDGVSSTNEFTVDWTAPASTTSTSISFYSAGNGVNGNGNSNGDGGNNTSITLNLTGSVSTSNPIAEEWGLNIFPNPVQKVLNLSVKNIENAEYQVSILNIIGQESFSQNINIQNGNAIIDVAHLPKGHYSLLLRKGNEKAVTKFVKN